MDECQKKDEKIYSKKDIENMLHIPCCHTTGMHDPNHFEERKYICHDQLAEAFIRFCREIDINPQTKSKDTCWWCSDHNKNKEKSRNGEGLELFKPCIPDRCYWKEYVIKHNRQDLGFCYRYKEQPSNNKCEGFMDIEED